MNSLNKLSEITVLFVGDRLLTDGDVPEQFCRIASKQYRTVHLHKQCADDNRLEDHCKVLQRPEWKSVCERADVVIVQEQGGIFGERSLHAIDELCTLFAEGTPIYSLITELDYPKELIVTKNNSYVYGGYAHHLLVGGGILPYEQLHQTGSVVPSKLYGYLTACVLYGTLFGVSCEMLSDESLDPEEIPGDSDRLKRETMRRIKRAADMACEFSREHAEGLKP